MDNESSLSLLTKAIPVLDHGFVKYRHHMGNDVAIVHNARQSYDAADTAGEDPEGDAKLIKYLMKNGHNTPFEACAVCIQIKAPIFVVRQWQRHRTQSYNELSARYRPLNDEYYVPERTAITTQSSDNKQMRTQDMHPKADSIRRQLESAQMIAHGLYKALLADGCPRELARMVLPVGTYTTFSATANLHNWMNFLKERLHEHAQYEIQVYAVEVARILSVLYPVTMQTFKELNS